MGISSEMKLNIIRAGRMTIGNGGGKSGFPYPIAMWLCTLCTSCVQPTSDPPLGRFSNNNLADPGYLLRIFSLVFFFYYFANF